MPWPSKQGSLIPLFGRYRNTPDVVFKLPAKVDACFQAMWKEIRRPKPGTEERLKEQAERTAWKILYDWVAVQVSLIQLEQAEIIEVFLPYAWDARKDQTYFEKLKANNFKQLEGPKEDRT